MVEFGRQVPPVNHCASFVSTTSHRNLISRSHFYYQIQISLKFLELFWAQNSVAETRIFTNISLCHTEFIVTFPRRVIDGCCLVHENCGLGSTLLPLKPGQSL